MRTRPLEGKLLWGVVAIFVIPTALTEGILVVLYRRGAFQDAWGLLLTILIGLPALMAYLGWLAYAIARPLVRTVKMIRDGTELMSTVNPDHRIQAQTGDELEALAANINRLADHLRDAERGVAVRLAAATRELQAERTSLAAILEGLADGVVVATLDGRITLANTVAQDLLAAAGPLVGHSLFAFIDSSQIARCLDQFRNRGRGPQRFGITTGEGVELHVGMTSLLGGDGRLTGFILALRDPSRAVYGIAEASTAIRPPTLLKFAGAGITSGVAQDTPGPVRPELYDFSLFEVMERSVSAVQREHRLDELPFVVLDVETTGLRPDADDRIVSVAGVRVRAGAVRTSEIFDALVCPDRPIPVASTRFHGITDAMVVEAPRIGVVLPAFLRFAEGAVLVGHEVTFDVAFLDRDARRLGLPLLTAGHPVLDTRLLSRLVHGWGPQHTLEAVAERLGVKVIGRHSALGDALTTAEIFVRLLALLKKRGLVTFGATLDALRRSHP
jgi:DNA polymerase III epsilon subunit family exonuclease